jgi:hypothetical protein
LKQGESQDCRLRDYCREAENKVDEKSDHLVPFGDMLGGISKTPTRPKG